MEWTFLDIQKVKEACKVIIAGFSTSAPNMSVTETNSTAMLSQLSAINGNTNLIETLQSNTNSLLTSISGYTDQLEGYVDSMESLLTLLGSNTDNIETLLTSLGLNTDGIEAGLSSIQTAIGLQAKLTDTQPVSIASIALPTGAATEATLSSIESKDFATQATSAAILAKIITSPATESKQDNTITALGNLLTELQLKADLTETQPVSISSISLAANAATESQQVLQLAEEQQINLNLDALTTEVQLTNTKLDLASTEATSSSILTAIGTLNTVIGVMSGDLVSVLSKLNEQAILTDTQPVSISNNVVVDYSATTSTFEYDQTQSLLTGMGNLAQSWQADSIITALSTKLNSGETVNVSPLSALLPPDGATESKQVEINTNLLSIQSDMNTSLNTLISKDFSTDTTLTALSAKVDYTNLLLEAANLKLDDINTGISNINSYTNEIPLIGLYGSDGQINAGSRSVSLTTSNDFTGTVLGMSVTPSTTYSFTASGINRLADIGFTISTGTLLVLSTR